MPMPANGQINALRQGRGLFENALSMLTSAAGEPAAGFAALAELARGGNAGEARDAVRQAFAYQPRTSEGQQQQRMLGEALGYVANSAPVKTWQQGVDIAGRYSPVAGAALQTVPTAIGVTMGAKPALRQGRALSELAGSAQRRMVQNAMAPSTINTGPMGRQRGVINASTTNPGDLLIDKWGDEAIYVGQDKTNPGNVLVRQGKAEFSMSPDNLTMAKSKRAKEAKQGTIRRYHGSYEPDAFVIGEGGKDRFNGIFTSRGGVEPAYSGYNYYVDIPEDKLLTQQKINYHIPYEDQVMAVEKVTGIKSSDPDFDTVFSAIGDDTNSPSDWLDDSYGVISDSFLAAMQRRGKFNNSQAQSLNAADASWEAQRLRGQFAKRLGFDAVDMDDETGTSTLVVKKIRVKPLK